MKYLTFTIPGKPLSKARPRFYKRGKFVKVYNSQEKEEALFAVKALKQFTGKKLSGPISVSLIFNFKRPKSHFRTGRYSDLLKDSSPLHHMIEPDVDNLIKFPLDALNKAVWYDDKQIVVVSGYKRYWENDETVITVMEV